MKIFLNVHFQPNRNAYSPTDYALCRNRNTPIDGQQGAYCPFRTSCTTASVSERTGLHTMSLIYWNLTNAVQSHVSEEAQGKPAGGMMANSSYPQPEIPLL